jgi:hypothetical protein
VSSPLVEQVRVDGGDQTALVVESRLASPELGTIEFARRLGLHRSHLYDRLAQAAAIVQVRWPDGRAWTVWFRERLASRLADHAWASYSAAPADAWPAGDGPAGTVALDHFDATARLLFSTDAGEVQVQSRVPVDLTYRSCSASRSPM